MHRHSVVLSSVLALATIASSPAAAVEAWVLNPNPTGDTHPVIDHNWNGTGDVNSIRHLSMGHYEVHLGSMPEFGFPQVVAYGAGPRRCSANGWSAGAPGVGGVTLDVACHEPDGTPADSKFVLWYTAGDESTTNLAMAHVDDPGATFTEPTNQFNSTGLPIGVRLAGPGRHTVTLAGHTSTQANIHVTANAATGAHCLVAEWRMSGPSVTVGVRCFDSMGGFANTPFTIRYANGNSALPHAFVAADQPTQVYYRPSPQYQFNALGMMNAAGRQTHLYWTEEPPPADFPYDRVFGPPVADRTYWVGYRGIGATQTSMAMMTALGRDTGNYCKLIDIPLSGPAIVEGVCFSPDGTETTAPYLQSYSAFSSSIMAQTRVDPDADDIPVPEGPWWTEPGAQVTVGGAECVKFADKLGQPIGVCVIDEDGTVIDCATNECDPYGADTMYQAQCAWEDDTVYATYDKVVHCESSCAEAGIGYAEDFDPLIGDYYPSLVVIPETDPVNVSLQTCGDAKSDQ